MEDGKMNPDHLDKAWHGKTLDEVLDAPVSALKGVTDADGEAIRAAFGVETIRAFAGLHLPRWAAEISAGGSATVNPEWVDKAGEGKTCEEIAGSPVAILQGLSDRQGALLAQAFQVKTVADLGRVRFFAWARALRDEAKG
jgi:hypothetical protein